MREWGMRYRRQLVIEKVCKDRITDWNNKSLDWTD